MKIGTIIQNPWVTSKSPLYRSIYLGTKGEYFETLRYYNRIWIDEYPKSTLKSFIIVGETKSFEFIQNELREERRE